MTKYAQWREISHIYYTLRCRCCSRNVFEQRKNALENTRENDNILGGVFKMQATFYILLSKFLFITVFYRTQVRTYEKEFGKRYA